MKYISLSNDRVMKLPFYLAMEEYVAKHYDFDESFFIWQVEPTVIFGRNQLIGNEVNLEYCKANGIEVYRRKSGGGCVYADRGNIMFSYISKDYNVADTYSKYLLKVVNVLNSLGVKAESTGRNDIIVNGGKISGNAFYHVNGKSVVHGTMLFDTDMKNMVNAITPSSPKLKSKGVDSVKSRITTLNKYLTITIEEFKTEIVRRLTDEIVKLDDGELAYIEEIEQEYYKCDFIYGNNPNYNIVNKSHIDGVGEFDVMIEVRNSKIYDINILGDFFVSGELDAELLQRLKSLPYNKDAICKVLRDVNVSNIIMNLSNEQFINLIIT